MTDNDLFDESKPPRIWTPGGESSQPVVFLRELVLLESLTPGAATVLRRVPFRAGLNIIWADPKTAEAKAGGTRWAGHSAGKTTLCTSCDGCSAKGTSPRRNLRRPSRWR